MNRFNSKNTIALFMLSLLFNGRINALPMKRLSCEAVFNNSPQVKESQFLFDSRIQSPSVAHFQLQADFAEAINKSGGGNWTGDDRPYSQYGVPAQLIIPAKKNQNGFTMTPDVIINSMIRVRGMSSADSSPLLPKFKLKFDPREHRRHPLAYKKKGFRINTSGFFGLDRAPFREALLYEIAQILKFPTVKIQRANIEYTQSPANKEMQNRLHETEALLLENDKSFLESQGFKEYYPDLDLDNYHLNHHEASRYYLFQAMIGNADFGLRTRNESGVGTEKYRPLFNTSLVYKNEGDEFIPTVYDLDKSLMVHLQVQRNLVTSSFLGQKLQQYQLNQLMRLLSLKQKFTDEEINVAIKNLQSHQKEILNLLKDRREQKLISSIDAPILENLLQQFFTILPTIHQYDLNLKEVRVYRSPSLKSTYQLSKSKVTDDYIPLRPGTPMRVLKVDQKNKSLQIAFLDLRNDFPAYSKTGEIIAYIPIDTPIGKSLAIEDLGYLNEKDMMY